MWTTEGRKVDVNAPLQEYPTPQFRRDSFICLNGPWRFQIDEKPDNHSYYPNQIIVPFAVETPLSGVQHRVKPGEILHYKKVFTLPEGFNTGRVLLHFEAVDQVCDVYLNGVHIAHHEGGYLPFTIDCLELARGKNELLVDVTDDTSSPIYPRGKQSLNPSGIWYEGTSGIWGSVWIESTPKAVIQSLRIMPLFDEKKVLVAVNFEGRVTSSRAEVSIEGKVIGTASLNEKNYCVIDVSSFWREWTPDHPFLYDLKVRVNEDEVNSYFAMRKFEVVEYNGHKVFGLNGKPYFLSALLDQGYWPDGGLTAPSDKAIVNDLLMVKEMGFNSLRKHIKIESMRWYYHCDRLGIIVLQDFVNGGAKYKMRYLTLAPFFSLKVNDETKYESLGRIHRDGRRIFEEEMPKAVDRLYNVPSIAIWTLFNEGWGQFESRRLTAKLRELDQTRLIDSTSGWFDQGAGDFLSRHIYFRKIRLNEARGRILALTEFGGYVNRISDHSYKNKNIFYKSVKDLGKALTDLYEKEVYPCLKIGLSICVYTQLSDVEQEANGLVTYDRKVVKVEYKTMKSINQQLKFRGV